MAQRVVTWRSNMERHMVDTTLATSMELRLQLKSQKTELESRVKSAVVQQQLRFREEFASRDRVQALQQLRQIMLRLVKGESAMRVDIWRTEVKEKARALQLAQVQRDLASQLADVSKGAGLRLLKQIMIRLAKGETAMRVEVWRQQVEMASHSWQRETEAALRNRGKRNGVRLLAQAVHRITKGEASFSLAIWRAAVIEHNSFTQLEAMESLRLQALKACHHTQSMGLRHLHGIFGRAIHLAVASMVQRWWRACLVERHAIAWEEERVKLRRLNDAALELSLIHI